MFSQCVRWLVLMILPFLPIYTEGQDAGISAGSDYPNFILDISREFVNATVARTIDRTDPVNDVILKTELTGTGRTVANVSAELIPYDQMAIIDLVTNGTTRTETIGINGPVQLYSTSIIPFQIRQRVYLRPEGLVAEVPTAHAQSRSTLNGLDTDFNCLLDRLVTKIAQQKYCKNREEADCIVSRHAEAQLVRRAQSEAGPQLSDADQSFQKQLADLRAKGIVFSALGFASTSDTLLLSARIATPQTVTASPPVLGERPYLALRVNESAINETARVNVAGKTYTGEDLEKKTKKLGFTDPPKQQEDKDFSITFVKDKPVEVNFTNQGVRAVFRLAEFTSGDNEYDGMDMTVFYKLIPAGDKIKAVREGLIEAFPPGFKTGQKLSGRQQAMRTVLQKRFGKFFKEELILKDVELSKNLQKAGPLAATRAETKDGWLLMTWRKGSE